jgi:hypothetical protein
MDIDVALDDADAAAISRNNALALTLPATCEPPSEQNPATQKVWIVSFIDSMERCDGSPDDG